MILQALNEHYWRLLEDEETHIAPPGYSPARVSHVLVLDDEGIIVDVLPLGTQQGKRILPKTLLVPEQAKRASGINANYLCDNVSYVLGLEQKNGKVIFHREKFIDFRDKNVALLQNIADPGAQALVRFLTTWDEQKAATNAIIQKFIADLFKGSNIVFKLDGDLGYIHERKLINQAWAEKFAAQVSGVVAQCLVTGKVGPIARLHPSIKNIAGAQPTGASLVSFNFDALVSYAPGKRSSDVQSYNSPVSELAAHAYATALNYLLASDTNRIRLADTTVVFWAAKKGGKNEEQVLAWCLDPVDVDSDTGKENSDKWRVDPVAARQAKAILTHVKAGLPIVDASFDAAIRCYLLGLAPNVARLAVRFWQVSSFGDLLTRIARHYQDMEIVGLERIGDFVSPRRTLKSLAVQGKAENIHPLLGGQVLQAVLSGQMYPQTLYNMALNRCHTGGEHGGVNAIRAAVIKAFLLRKYRINRQTEKEAMITMSLYEDNPSTAYQLGRLFSLLEKVQKDALGDLNASIRDRYFGSASATPAAVFPLLLRLSRHHIAKANYGEIIDRKIQDVMNRFNAFPAHLSLDEQGQFILGYYHQNQANYVKSEQKCKTKINEEEKEDE